MRAVLLFSLVIVCFAAHAQCRRSSRSSLRYTESGLPILEYDCKRIPSICKNTRDAIDSGTTQYLTRSRTGISKNRYSACGGMSAPSGMSCDEFPFASTRQGGKRAKTNFVPARENYSQGGQISAFYRKAGLKNNGRFYLEYPKL